MANLLSEIQLPNKVTYKLKDSTLAFSDGIEMTTNASTGARTVKNTGIKTLSVAAGSENGTIDVTINGTKSNIAIPGLESAAYQKSTTWLPVAGGTMTGNINRYYGDASTDPMIKLNSNNKDAILFSLGHGTSATATPSSGYQLIYKGTGSDPNNNLLLTGNYSGTITDIFSSNQSGVVTMTGTMTHQNGTAASTSKDSSQLMVANTGTGAVAIELRRKGSNAASWQIINNSGNLIFRNDYNGSAQSTTYVTPALTLAYGTGAATFNNTVTATGFIGPLTGKATSAATATTADTFSSNATVALTGIVTGTSAGSKKSWTIETSIADGAIANVKLANSSIKIGNKTISLGGTATLSDIGVSYPVTSVAGKTGNVDTTTLANILKSAMGLSNAMHFVGIATKAISDQSKTDPVIEGYDFGTSGAKAQPGDVVIDKESDSEYVWSPAGHWERLGPDSSYSLNTHVHGNITNKGAVTTTATIGDGDTLLIADKNAGEAYAVTGSSITFDGKTKTDALTKAGTWQTFLTSHRSYTAFTGKPTNNQTPDFGATFTIQQISQNAAGQVSGTDRTVKIPDTIATNEAIGLVKPWFNHTKASTGPKAGSDATAVTVNTLSTNAGKYYAVESDSDGRLFVNVPWANTTYTFGNGVSASGTTVSNSGVRSIAAGSADGTISVNTNGTTANVAIKGLKSAAYTESSAYATSDHKHDDKYVALTNGVTAVTYDSTNKKITRTINGTAADVVTVATLKTAMGLAKGDVDLGNVTNEAQIAKSIGTAKGDIIYFSGSATPVRLAVGSSGQVLKVSSSGIPAWAADNNDTTHLYVNDTAAGATSNAVTTNTTTYLHLYDTTTKRETIQIKGASATSVSATAAGVITITSTNSRDPGYGSIASGAASTATTALTANATTVAATTYNEKLTLGAGNKWIVTAATNSATAGSDVFNIGHALSDITAGTFGSTTKQTPTAGNTFNIPYVTVDAAGHVTAAGTSQVQLPADTNNAVTQSATTSAKWRKLLMHYTEDATSTAAVASATKQVYGAIGISAQASTGTLRATAYNVADKAQIQYNTTDNSIDFIFI